MKLPQIRNAKWVPKTHHIGVIGVSNSGKTVLLTSLIDHLKQHDPEHPNHFPLSLKSLGGKVSIRYGGDLEEDLLDIDHLAAEDVEDEDTGQMFEHSEIGLDLALFPFGGNRDMMTRDGQWPDKTVSLSRFGCRIDLRREETVNAYSKRKVWLYDIPGERLADIEMVRCSSYEKWSDTILSNFGKNGAVQTRALTLVGQTKPKGLTEEQAIRGYKKLLVECYRECMETISPSVFRLDVKGDELNPEHDEEQILSERFSGLGSATQFMPLSKESRQNNPELAVLFATRFRQYRDKVARPLMKVLNACDSLILLVDVANILQGGPAAYKDNRQLIGGVLHFLNDRNTPTKRLIRGATWGKNLKNVAFVVPKTDLFAKSDIQSGRPRELLKAFVRTPLQQPHVGKINFQCFQCYAAQAAITKSEEDGTYTLTGYNLNASDGMKELGPFRRLPEQWPEHWNRGDYKFPDLRPLISGITLEPPKQNGLDQVFAFALEGPQQEIA
jgi:predicted YcjX-like family ATPase